MPRSRSLLFAALAGPALALAGLVATASRPVIAQEAPLTLPPPSLTNPGSASASESGTATKPRAKKPARRAAKAADDPTKLKRAKRDDPDFAQGEAMQRAKPRRFVPEEFDQGDGSTDGGASPRPFMSPSGRAGVGMRF